MKAGQSHDSSARSITMPEISRFYGIIIAKWLPSVQGINPGDTGMKSFYSLLRELDLPLLTHTGNEESFTRVDNSLAESLRLRNALDEGVTVIAAHCASNGRHDGLPNMERLMLLLEEYPNLYADISSLTQVNRLGHLPRVLRHLQRFLKG